ncbi:MAG: galactose/glucose ABC transporter substrate-binding protein MglB [Tissierellales bacterium]|nr:galactose/glucose ABC transporter substrate-binding protein MglB [Tissierellales bacterium]
MKKSLVLLIVVAMLVLSLAGCTSNGEESTNGTNDKLKIGVLIYKYDDTYISTVRQAIEKEAENDTEVELLMNDGQGDQSKQNDQIDILIEKGVDALAVNIVDIGAASSVIDKAKSAGIPVVFFNREPDTEVIKSYDKARFVGTKPEEAGIIQGQMMAEVWNEGKYDRNGDNIMQYVMLKGDADNPEAIARTEYSIKTLNEAGIKTEELGLQVANWDNDKANQAMEAWLAKFGDKIEFVIANNDGMASGAISALQNAGYNTGDSEKYIPVFGVDATEEAINLIKKGAMTGTVKQDGEGMGKAVFALAKNAAQGKDFLEGTSYEYDETGVAVRIPYQPYK